MPDRKRSRGVKVLLVAEEAAGIQVLRAIQQTPHSLAGVVTSAAPRGAPRGATVRDVAERLQCPVWPPEVVRDPDFSSQIRRAAVEVLLNVHSLRVVHPAVLEAPSIGSFNLHPGPLPEYAGLNAPSWAIYNGEGRHAVTVHWMSAEIDGGPVAFRQEVETCESDTGLTLSAKCVHSGVPLLLRLLEVAAADPAAIPRVPQDRLRWRYYGRQVPEHGRLRWSQPAERILRFVRACDYFPLPSPWGYPRTSVAGEPCGVVKAARTGKACGAPAGTVGEVTDSGAWVAAQDEWITVSRVNLRQRTVRAADVLKKGARLED